jgi:hypothetical protein
VRSLIFVSLLVACSSSEGEPAAPNDAEVDSAAVDSSVTPDTMVGADAATEAATETATDAGKIVPGFPVPDPPAGFDGLPTSPPLEVTGATMRTISNLSITNPSGPCVLIHGGSDIVLEHLAIGPCKGNGIQIDGKATRVTVRDVYVHDTGGNGIETEQSTDILVTTSHFARGTSGGYFVDGSGIVFERNWVLDVQGPAPRGNMAQFNRVSGKGNAIRCNVVENHAGKSSTEDNVNMFQCNGDPSSPIVIEGNRIFGGGPSTSGGGIILGDGGGSYQIARDNVVVDPGQYGISIASGDHMTIEKNRVFGKSQPFTNVGIYAWNQYMTTCTDVTVKDNQVNWRNKDGNPNPWWDGGNCKPLVESGNTWNATFDATVIDHVPDACL